MNMQAVVTPFQKQLADAHKARERRFFPIAIRPVTFAPSPIPRPVELPLIGNDQYALAWRILSGHRNVPITMAVIKAEVCHYFNITPTRLLSKRRFADIVRSRQIAMFLADQYTTLSMPQIAKPLGDLDHTTIMHGVRSIKARMEHDAVLVKDILAIEELLGV